MRDHNSKNSTILVKLIFNKDLYKLVHAGSEKTKADFKKIRLIRVLGRKSASLIINLLRFCAFVCSVLNKTMAQNEWMNRSEISRYRKGFNREHTRIHLPGQILQELFQKPRRRGRLHVGIVFFLTREHAREITVFNELLCRLSSAFASRVQRRKRGRGWSSDFTLLADDRCFSRRRSDTGRQVFRRTAGRIRGQ